MSIVLEQGPIATEVVIEASGRRVTLYTLPTIGPRGAVMWKVARSCESGGMISRHRTEEGAWTAALRIARRYERSVGVR